MTAAARDLSDRPQHAGLMSTSSSARRPQRSSRSRRHSPTPPPQAQANPTPRVRIGINGEVLPWHRCVRVVDRDCVPAVQYRSPPPSLHPCPRIPQASAASGASCSARRMRTRTARSSRESAADVRIACTRHHFRNASAMRARRGSRTPRPRVGALGGCARAAAGAATPPNEPLATSPPPRRFTTPRCGP